MLLPKEVAICWKQAVTLLRAACARSHSFTCLFLVWISTTDCRQRLITTRVVNDLNFAENLRVIVDLNIRIGLAHSEIKYFK